MSTSNPRPFTHVVAIEDRILVIDHDPFLPFCSEATDPDSSGDGSTDATAAED